MQTYQDILTLSIFVLGILTVMLSSLVALKFKRYRDRLSGGSALLAGAISWQLVGEAGLGLGTLMFSAAAHIGVLESWTIEVQSGLRFGMFFLAAITTWHLYRTLKRLG